MSVFPTNLRNTMNLTGVNLNRDEGKGRLPQAQAAQVDGAGKTVSSPRTNRTSGEMVIRSMFTPQLTNSTEIAAKRDEMGAMLRGESFNPAEFEAMLGQLSVSELGKPDSTGMTLASTAVSQGNQKAVSMLREKGASFDSKNTDGSSANSMIFDKANLGRGKTQ